MPHAVVSVVIGTVAIRAFGGACSSGTNMEVVRGARHAIPAALGTEGSATRVALVVVALRCAAARDPDAVPARVVGAVSLVGHGGTNLPPPLSLSLKNGMV